MAQPTGDELALRRRVSDLEREDVAEVLRAAAGEGRLSFTELEDRLETTYNAKTYGELVHITADLPGGPSAPSTPAQYSGEQHPAQYAQSDSTPVINTFLAETKRTGGWLAPQRQEVNAVLGDVTLDYTEAQLPYDEIFVEVKSILSEVKIRVPQNAIVHLDGNPILGSVTEQEAGFGGAVDPATGPVKVFHIRGTAILGEIKVKRGPRLSKRLRLT
ncbi:cell wall-active antibiotic response 4TMS protein YvqF [Kribbella amoyensis]|uniref:Cell wall-active antibiotic response 4TMS protein YvqF n=1 Tax=Kribbella amoyensis TaxID=996641 RepID=A0A561B3C3_9ACTN|nr:cell wall-active antibiotic response 4TMS protein YvqF [Kribbella amoyensis]